MGVPPVPARRRAVALAVSATLCGLAAFALSVPAGANPPGPHDPIGHVGRSVQAVEGGIVVHGWAADPDDLADNLTIKVLQDGHVVVARGVTDQPNPSITKEHGTGPTPGFQLTVPVSTRPHTVCVVAIDRGPGVNTVLKCIATPLGRTPSSDELAAHSPLGAITRARASAAHLHIKGWTSDPDYVARRSTAVLYVDGSPAATVTTTVQTAPLPDGAGPKSAFDISVPVSPGAHLGCIWAVNVGFGDNVFLGCRAVDTRGAPGTDPVAPTAATKKVVTVAKNQIGDRYVWGATGPSSFDCSGLVVYSYGKAQMFPPRVSEDQFAAARLIPAARAVPGDLVFWHDSEGDVYHVGIYLAPGKTVAAIDPADGVNYQKLWDPTIVTYGSFTHD